MKFNREPIHPVGDGPWGVDSIGRSWYVVHATTLRAKRIGPVRLKGTNYFDRAMQEAARRNTKEKT